MSKIIIIMIIIFYSVITLIIRSTASVNTTVTRYYTQPLDHFGFGSLSVETFKQKIILDLTFGPFSPNSPILVFFGAESHIGSFFYGPGIGPGILTLAASHFRAPMVYIEHRFYGESVPNGSIYLAMLDVEVRGCLTSTQALADFANVIIGLKNDYSTVDSPVIVMGGSYGGMLASWFRLKYPHIAIGALASSAPVLSILEIPIENQYCSIVSKDFRDTNRKCFDHISKSWAMIDDIAKQPQGLKILDQTFKTCSPLFEVNELKGYLALLYRFVAQYNGRFSRISMVCDEIAHVSEDEIVEGISRASLKLSNPQLQVCNDIRWMASNPIYILNPASQLAWNWQMCSELLSAQNACSNDSMFEPHTFNISEHMNECFKKYGVYPHISWLSTYYGGQGLKSALKTFGSNIIFSNGLKDPLSGASILHDISETIVAINTNQGSHSLDMTLVRHDDPKWLKELREKELKIMSKWVKNNSNHGFKLLYSNLFSLIVMSFIVPYM